VDYGQDQDFVFRHPRSVTDVPTHQKLPKCEAPPEGLWIGFSRALKVNYDATHSDRCCETEHLQAHFKTHQCSVGTFFGFHFISPRKDSRLFYVSKRFHRFETNETNIYLQETVIDFMFVYYPPRNESVCFHKTQVLRK
jgi:hypothetical protein